MKRRVDDRPGIVNTALNLGKVTLDRFRTLEEDRERLEHAKAWFHEGLALAEEIGDQPSSVNHLHALATVAQLEGDLCEARRLCERSLDLSRAFGGLTYEAWSLTGLALVDIEEGRFADAWRRCLSGLELFRRANVADSHEPLGILAGAAAGLERREDAVLLVAAGFARAEDSGVEMPPLTRRRLEGLRDELRDVVDEETFVRLWAEGRDIGADALIAQLAADA